MATMVSPSLLSADFLNLSKDVTMINNSDADWLHLDIMDGMFVPNISFGFSVLEALPKELRKPMDVHFMISIDFFSNIDNVHLKKLSPLQLL